MSKKTHLAIYCGAYAVIYTFCLYGNLAGITFPLFVAATLFFGILCFREFDVKIKVYSRYIGIGALLIGVSQMLTDNSFIHFTNILIVYGLLILFFMNQFADDEKWDFTQYLTGIFITIVKAIGHMLTPFSDLSAHHAETEAKSRFPWKTVMLTIVCAFPMLLLIVILLTSADAIFENIVNSLVDFENISTYIKIAVLTLVVFLFSYGLVSYLTKKPFENFCPEKKKYDAVVAITVGLMFDLVYLVFSFVQIFGLFMGNFQLPSGTTYAEYAREGFFQLLIVCLFNLVFVIVGMAKFNENMLVKIILTVTCVCTYVMIASSAFRMILYIRYYYFTFYRILVLWTLAVIAFLMTMVVVRIWKPSFNLFKAAIITAMIFYLLLAFSHTDYFVAKWNISERAGHSEFFLASNDYNDYDMLCDLSLDAAPIVLDPANNISTDNTGYLYELQNEKYDFRKFNVSRYIAKQYLPVK